MKFRWSVRDSIARESSSSGSAKWSMPIWRERARGGRGWARGTGEPLGGFFLRGAFDPRHVCERVDRDPVGAERDDLLERAPEPRGDLVGEAVNEIDVRGDEALAAGVVDEVLRLLV